MNELINYLTFGRPIVRLFSPLSKSTFSLSFFLSLTESRSPVCCFVLLKQYREIVTVPGFHHNQSNFRRAHAHDWESLTCLPESTCPPQTTLGGRIPALYFNYVAGCINPLLFLFVRTQQLTPLTTRGSAPVARVWAGPKFLSLFVCCSRHAARPLENSKFVRPHRWCVYVALRVEFLLKTESGYLRDAEVTWFTLANP